MKSNAKLGTPVRNFGDSRSNTTGSPEIRPEWHHDTGEVASFFVFLDQSRLTRTTVRYLALDFAPLIRLPGRRQTVQPSIKKSMKREAAASSESM